MTPFDEKFRRELDFLSILARRAPTGGQHALQDSAMKGAGVEFADYRGYVPGDDLRAVDWALKMRLGKTFVRLFVEERDLPLYILLDRSRSMAEPFAQRWTAADQLAAALAYISVHQHDRVQLFPFAEELAPPLRCSGGTAAFLRIAAFIESTRPAGTTHLAQCLRHFAAMRLRRGIVALISDGFDPLGAEALIDALRTVRHHPALFLVTHRGDRDLQAEGDVRAIDVENGERLDITLSPDLIARVAREYDAFIAALEAYCKRRGASFLRVDCGAAVLPQLRRLFIGGRLLV